MKRLFIAAVLCAIPPLVCGAQPIAEAASFDLVRRGEPSLIDRWKCFPHVMVHQTAEAMRLFLRDGVRGIFECGEQDQLEQQRVALWRQAFWDWTQQGRGQSPGR
jgi:hypothetical protein